VPRRIAAIHFQLAVRHDDSGAELDMGSAEWRIIAYIRDYRDVAIPIAFKRIRIVGVGTSAARNGRIIRLHERFIPLRNRGIDGCPLPLVSGRQGRRRAY